MERIIFNKYSKVTKLLYNGGNWQGPVTHVGEGEERQCWQHYSDNGKKPWDNADTEMKFVQQVTVFKLLHSSLYLFITDDYYNKNLLQYWLTLDAEETAHNELN